MIKLYKRKVSGDLSCKKAEEWLIRHSLPYRIITPQNITYDLVQEMLSLSENGFEDILLSRTKGQKTWEAVKKNFSEKKLSQMTTNELIKCIEKKPCLLKSPIIFNEKCLLSGYNSDEIRAFLPRIQRRVDCN
ncbi:ArsC/Spx/MgsR family protein [Lactococcus taiwanensis]|uniref:ArsC/Spx/MgsR family protein n=1 Tax=Lactococcus taiwanensis TaxID=1151742 RepID=UPI00351471B1